MELRKLFFGVAALILGLLANGCSPSIPVTSANAKPGLNLIVVAEGEVQLKRNNWTDYHTTSFGAALYRGDQIRPAANARVVVLCEDLTAWSVPAGPPSGLNNGCPQVSEPALVRAGGLIANTRGGVDPLIPYIISPRATKLLDPKPTLRWNAVPGAKTYTLHISGTDWKVETDKTEFVYPGDPPLQPGVDYLLTVESDTGKSSRDEGIPGLGFSLMTEAEAGRVRTDVTTLDALNLSDKAKAFALAQLYSGHNLYAEAIAMLEKLVDGGSQAANVYRALGELYQQVGVLPLAEARYSRALELAEASGDVEGAAEAQAKLGGVYLALGHKNDAVDSLTEAQAGYTSLGDAQHASQIATQIADLNQ